MKIIQYNKLNIALALAYMFPSSLIASNVTTTTLKISSTNNQAQLVVQDGNGQTPIITSSGQITCNSTVSPNNQNGSNTNTNANDKLESKLCDQFLSIARGQMDNMLQLIQKYHPARSGNTYAYDAYFNFHTINENNVVSYNSCDNEHNPKGAPCFSAPDTTTKNNLFKLLNTLNTSNLNYASRILPMLSGDNNYTPYQQPLSYMTTGDSGSDYLNQAFTTIQGFANDAGMDNQIGGGGGFGCVVGIANQSSGGLLSPSFQFGGGFGQGHAMANGLDFGFGGGSSICTQTNDGNCQQSGTLTFGGGGGVNYYNDSKQFNSDQQTLSSADKDNYLKAIQGIFTDTSANNFYMACGLGGGTGYQTLPQNSVNNNNIYQQPFGFGGGGYYLAIFTQKPSGKLLTAAQSETVDSSYDQQADALLDAAVLYQASIPKAEAQPIPTNAAPTLLSSGLIQPNVAPHASDLLMDKSTAMELVLPKNNLLKQYYGLYTADANDAKSTPKAGIDFSKLNENIGFIYEPYHFASTANPSTLNTYMPGTTSTADLFFAKNGNIKSNAGEQLFEVMPEVYCNRKGKYRFIDNENSTVSKDIKNILLTVSNQINSQSSNYKASVLYTLNTNPLSCNFVDKTIETQDKKAIVFKNINDYVIAKLNTAGIPVSLEVPLYVQSGNTAVQNAPDIINANQVYLGSYLRTNLSSDKSAYPEIKDTSGVNTIFPVQFAQAPIKGEVERLLETYPNIQAVILGDATNGTRYKYPTTCNGFTFSLPGNEIICQDFTNTIVYKDYAYLIANMEMAFDAIKKENPNFKIPTLSVNQTYFNWWIPQDYYNKAMKLPIPKDPDASKPWGLYTYLNHTLITLNNYFTTHKGNGVPVIKVTVNFSPMLTYLPDPDLNKTSPEEYIKELNIFAQLFGPNGNSSKNSSTNTENTPGNMYKPTIVVGLASGAGSDPSTNTSYIQAINNLQKSFAMVYVNELFDQPWKATDPMVDGAPGSLCGAVYPIPFADPNNLKGPPLPSQLPPVCAPDLAKQSPGDPAVPSCLCMINSTDYFSSYYNFVSDTAAPPTNPEDFIQMAPGTIVTYTNGDDHEAPESFFARFIAGKDGAFAIANLVDRYPEPQYCGFDQYDDYNCVIPYKNKSGNWNHFLPHSSLFTYEDASKIFPADYAGDNPVMQYGNQTPVISNAGVANDYGVVEPIAVNTTLPGLRCTGVSDAQTGAASANAAFDCTQVFFTYPPSSDIPTEPSNNPAPIPQSDNSLVSYPTCSNQNLASDSTTGTAESCGLPRYVFTQTGNPVKNGNKVSCKSAGSGGKAKLHNTMIKYVSYDADNTITLHWTVQGSKYKDVSGWQLKTLEAPTLKPCEAFNQKDPGWQFEQAPLVVIPQETTDGTTTTNPVTGKPVVVKGPNKIDDKHGTVSASYTYKGLPNGTYWFRLQPVGSMRSTDAIDMSFAPIQLTNSNASQEYALENLWHKVAKTTLDYPFSDSASGISGMPLIYSMKFTRPDGLSFTIVPPVDNGIADISMPSAAPPAPNQPQQTPTKEDIQKHTTILDINYFEPVAIPADGSTPASTQKTCQVRLYATAGKDPGDHGTFQFVDKDWKLITVSPDVKSIPQLAGVCFLEMAAGGFLNGGNIGFETKQLTSVMQLNEVTP